MDNWLDATYGLLLPTPEVSMSFWGSLSSLREWILSRVWPEREFDGPAWPHLDGYIWPHRVTTVCPISAGIGFAAPAGVEPGDARRAAPFRRNGRRSGKTAAARRPVFQRFFLPSTVRRNRNDSVPVSMMCARSVMRSSRALQSRGLGNTVVHSENGKFVVTISAARSARSAITWNRNSAPTSASGTSCWDTLGEQSMEISHESQVSRRDLLRL